MHAYGVRDFELTGGEPGEHEQVEDICKYIKGLSPGTKLAVITNGALCTRDVFSAVDEVLVSYHLSKSCESYDR